MGITEQILSRCFSQQSNAFHFSIELTAQPGSCTNKIIHLQSEKWRIELSEREYLELASAIIKAGSRLRALKGLNES